jgi:hypothetical protein
MVKKRRYKKMSALQDRSVGISRGDTGSLKRRTAQAREQMESMKVSKKCAEGANKDFADIEKSLYEDIK